MPKKPTPKKDQQEIDLFSAAAAPTPAPKPKPKPAPKPAKAAESTAPRSAPASKPKKRLIGSATSVVKRIDSEAESVRSVILKGDKPSMRFPVRSLQNVKYQPKVGYFELRGKQKERTLTVSTVKTFAQTLKMMSLSKELVQTDDIATKR